MVKNTLLVILLCGLFSILFLPTTLAEGLTPKVIVNDTELNFPDIKPFIDSNGRVQIPARFIGEALGANVTWDALEQKAVFVKENRKLTLYVGKRGYDLNGMKYSIDTVPLLIKGRIVVPARYVAEAFYSEVKWDNTAKTVYIKKVKTLSSNVPSVESNISFVMDTLKESYLKCNTVGLGMTGNAMFGSEFAKLLNLKPLLVNPFTQKGGFKTCGSESMKFSKLLTNKDEKYDSYALILLLADNDYHDDEIHLSGWKPDEIQAGCNKYNKGVVIAIGFLDAFYVYGIDENGNKVKPTIMEYSLLK